MMVIILFIYYFGGSGVLIFIFIVCFYASERRSSRRIFSRRLNMWFSVMCMFVLVVSLLSMGRSESKWLFVLLLYYDLIGILFLICNLNVCGELSMIIVFDRFWLSMCKFFMKFLLICMYELWKILCLIYFCEGLRILSNLLVYICCDVVKTIISYCFDINFMNVDKCGCFLIFIWCMLLLKMIGKLKLYFLIVFFKLECISVLFKLSTSVFRVSCSFRVGSIGFFGLCVVVEGDEYFKL